MLVGGGIVALEPRCLNAFMFVKCFANSAEYRSPAKFQLIVARLSSPRRTPRTWIQIHSACRRMEMDFMNIPEQNELPPPFHSFHPTIRCLELILFCRILSNTRRNDEENIICLPSGESIEKWQEFANDPIDICSTVRQRAKKFLDKIQTCSTPNA